MKPIRYVVTTSSLIVALAAGLAGCGGGGGSNGGGTSLPSGSLIPPPGQAPGTPSSPSSGGGSAGPSSGSGSAALPPGAGSADPGSGGGASVPAAPSADLGPVVAAPGAEQVVSAPGAAPVTSPAPRGSARVIIRWPDGEGSPLAASRSVKIVVTLDGQTLGEQTLVRPDAQYNSSSVLFSDLPPAVVTVRATAYPNADGTGTAQATGSFDVAIKPGETVPVGVNLATTISQVRLDQANVTLAAGQTVQLEASARDARGAAVLTDSANWTWTSDNPAAASVNGNGDKAAITGGSLGSATLTVRESTSGASASATVAVASYSANFESVPGSEWSKTSIEVTPVGGRKFLGPLSNETVSLTLNNLPPHSRITVTFDLLIIQSWDGNNTNPGYGPDIWSLSVEGGPTLLNTTFNNHVQDFWVADPAISREQAYPNDLGGSNLAQTGAAERNSLGYSWLSEASDSVYRVTRTFEHSGSTLKLNFVGTPNQPANDESWGLDNVTVRAE